MREAGEKANMRQNRNESKDLMPLVIFVGPSITQNDHHELTKLKGVAEIRPPIKRGDIELEKSNNTKRILIIDGVFEAENPIWQREIYALTSKILV